MNATNRLVTAQDVWMMGEDACVERVRGVLRERPPAGGQHGGVGGRFVGYLWQYGTETGSGEALSSGTGYILETSPDTLLVPDVAFVKQRHLPPANAPDWFIATPPDVALEVLSPSRRFGELVEKVGIYLTAGVPLVWLALLRERRVAAFSADQLVRGYRSGEILDGGDVLPGFSVPVAEIFE